MLLGIEQEQFFEIKKIRGKTCWADCERNGKIGLHSNHSFECYCTKEKFNFLSSRCFFTNNRVKWVITIENAGPLRCRVNKLSTGRWPNRLSAVCALSSLVCLVDLRYNTGYTLFSYANSMLFKPFAPR